jgi:hypothetical protein
MTLVIRMDGKEQKSEFLREAEVRLFNSASGETWGRVTISRDEGEAFARVRVSVAEMPETDFLMGREDELVVKQGDVKRASIRWEGD